jgi:hypothetical protein
MGWSDWKKDWDHDVLARIVALLFALANLADLASRFPARRRREALGFVCWGEGEARAFVVGMALEYRTEKREAVSGRIRCSNIERRHDSDEMPVDAPIEDDGPAFFDDAAGLAARLRVLAFVLWFLLAQAGRLARPGANPRALLRRKPAGRSMPAGPSAHAAGNAHCRRPTSRKIDPG